MIPAIPPTTPPAIVPVSEVLSEVGGVVGAASTESAMSVGPGLLAPGFEMVEVAPAGLVSELTGCPEGIAETTVPSTINTPLPSLQHSSPLGSKGPQQKLPSPQTLMPTAGVSDSKAKDLQPYSRGVP